MSDILSIVVLLALCVGFFKMYGRYIAGVIAGAVLGGIIGAIFTDGLWDQFAGGGAVVGFIITFIVCFSEAWRTLLGTLIGGLIGYGIGYFIKDDTTMWTTDIMLALALLGGILASSQAAEDLFEEMPKPKLGKYKDPLGKEHQEHPFLCYKCGTCGYYKPGGHCLKHNLSVRDSDHACDDYT